MTERGAADSLESDEPEAWLQGAIARLFGDGWEAKPRGAPERALDAWMLGNLHAPAIDLATASLIEIQFPINQWGEPLEGETCVRKLLRGTPVRYVSSRTREEAAKTACALALELGVSSVRVREQKGEEAPAGREIYYTVPLEDVHLAVCRTGPNWESSAARDYWERNCKD